MATVFDWVRHTQEYLAWGANWQTIGALGAILMTFVQTIGLSSQIRTLGSGLSAETVEFRMFAWQQCLFLSCVSYGIDIGSVAMICSGVSLSCLHAIILYRLHLSDSVFQKDWADLCVFAVIIIWPIVTFSQPWRSAFFLAANAGAIWPMVKQYQRLGKLNKTGAVDPKMLTLMTVSMGFWVVYSFAIRNTPLMIINPIIFGIMVATLLRWLRISANEKIKEVMKLG